MIPPELISWNKKPENFVGDIAATIARDAEGWRQIGASFSTIDDPESGEVAVASARVQTAIGRVEFGILDYGDATTYMLVPATDEAKSPLVATVLDSLQQLDLLSSDEVLDERSPYEVQASLEARVTALEHWAGDELSEVRAEPEGMTRASTPGAAYRQFEKQTPGRQESRTRTRTRTGTVKWFSDDKGYGFIKPDDGSKDIFVHHSAILGEGFRSLTEGAKVTYESPESDQPQGSSSNPAHDAEWRERH